MKEIVYLAAGQPETLHLKLKYDQPFFFHTVPLIILSALAAIFFIFLVWLFYRWAQSRYVFCPECKTRNFKNNELCVRCGAGIKNPPLTEEQKKWFGAFGWTKNPFILDGVPDTLIGRKAEILLIIEKLNTLSGHILIIGGIGIGKTKLLHWLEKHLEDKYETIYVMHPPVYPEEFINFVSSAIANKAFSSKKIDAYEFYELCKTSRKKILILLDKVQQLPDLFQPFLPTLANLPNVFLVMAGSSDAREMIKHDMPVLFDRIVETVFLGALTRGETEDLIRDRISDAGGKGLGPFNSPAIEEIYALSYGIPLGTLKICDWAVATAVHSNKPTIDRSDIRAYIPGKRQGG